MYQYNERRTMQTEVKYNQPFKEYHSQKEYVSASELKLFMDCPENYFAKVTSNEQEEETEALIFGSALHCYILEREKFDKEFFVLDTDKRPVPQSTFAKKENSEWLTKIKHENAGKTIISKEQLDKIKKITQNANRDKYINLLLSNGISESSYYGVHEKTDVKIRGRVDRVPNFGASVVDLKSCNDSSIKAFTNQIISYKYFIQVPQYLYLTGKSEFVFIALEKDNNYIPQAYRLDEDFILWAYSQWEMYLTLFAWCKKNNLWVDYIGFDILKNLYKNNYPLDDYHEIRQNIYGIHTIELPKYLAY